MSAHLSSGSLSSSLVWVDLLAVLVVPNPWGGSTVPTTFPRSDTNDLAVNSTGNAVLKLQVHFWYSILRINGCITDITDSSGLHHITDGKSLNRLVLGSASRAVGAADGLDMTTALLVATIGSSLLDHIVGSFSLSFSRMQEGTFVVGR